MTEQIPFVIMTIILVAMLFIIRAAIYGGENDSDESEKRSARSQE